jgi:hypothetical protein
VTVRKFPVFSFFEKRKRANRPPLLVSAAGILGLEANEWLKKSSYQRLVTSSAEAQRGPLGVIALAAAGAPPWVKSQIISESRSVGTTRKPRCTREPIQPLAHCLKA